MNKIVISTESATISIENTLSSKDRDALPDSAYGLPKDRKYPLYNKNGKPDEAHIRSAMSYFHKCPEDKKHILARNILKAAKKAGMDIDKKSDWYKYV